MESIFEEINQDYGLPNVELGRGAKRNSTPAPPSVKSSSSPGESGTTGALSASRCQSSAERDLIDYSPSTSGENDSEPRRGRTSGAVGAISVRMRGGDKMHGTVGSAPINLPNAQFMDAQPVRSKFGRGPKGDVILEENTQTLLCSKTKQWLTVSVRPKFRWHNECIFSLDAFYQGRSTTPPEFYSLTSQGVTLLKVLATQPSTKSDSSNCNNLSGGRIVASRGKSATTGRGQFVAVGSVPNGGSMVLAPAADVEASQSKKRKPTESVEYINPTTKKNDLGFHIAARPLKVRTVRDPDTGIVKRYPINCAPSASCNSAAKGNPRSNNGGVRQKRAPRGRKRPVGRDDSAPVLTPCVPHASTSAQSSISMPTLTNSGQVPMSMPAHGAGNQNGPVTAIMINGSMFTLPAGAQVVVVNPGSQDAAQGQMVIQGGGAPPTESASAQQRLEAGLMELNGSDTNLPSVYPELPSVPSVNQCDQLSYQPNDNNFGSWNQPPALDTGQTFSVTSNNDAASNFDDILMTAWRATIDDPLENHSTSQLPAHSAPQVTLSSDQRTFPSPASNNSVSSRHLDESTTVLTELNSVPAPVSRGNSAKSDIVQSKIEPNNNDASSSGSPTDSGPPSQPALSSQICATSKVADIIASGLLTETQQCSAAESSTAQTDTAVSWSVEAISSSTSASAYLADEFVNHPIGNQLSSSYDISNEGHSSIQPLSDVILGNTVTMDYGNAANMSTDSGANMLLKDVTIDCSASMVASAVNCELSDELKSHMQAIGDFSFDATLTELSTADVGCALSQLSSTLDDTTMAPACSSSSADMNCQLAMSSPADINCQLAMTSPSVTNHHSTMGYGGQQTCPSSFGYVPTAVSSMPMSVEPQSVSAALSTITCTLPAAGTEQVPERRSACMSEHPASVGQPNSCGVQSPATPMQPETDVNYTNREDPSTCQISPLAPCQQSDLDLASLVDDSADIPRSNCEGSSDSQNLLMDQVESKLPSVESGEAGSDTKAVEENTGPMTSDRPGPMPVAKVQTSSSPVPEHFEEKCGILQSTFDHHASILHSNEPGPSTNFISPFNPGEISHSVANLLWQPKMVTSQQASTSHGFGPDNCLGLFTPPHESSSMPPIPSSLLPQHDVKDCASEERKTESAGNVPTPRKWVSMENKLNEEKKHDAEKFTDHGDDDLTVLESLQLLEDSLNNSPEKPATGQSTAGTLPIKMETDHEDHQTHSPNEHKPISSPITTLCEPRHSQQKVVEKSDWHLQEEQDDDDDQREVVKGDGGVQDELVEQGGGQVVEGDGKEAEKESCQGAVPEETSASTSSLDASVSVTAPAPPTAPKDQQSAAEEVPEACDLAQRQEPQVKVAPCRFNLWERLKSPPPVKPEPPVEPVPIQVEKVRPSEETRAIPAPVQHSSAVPIKLRIKKSYAAAMQPVKIDPVPSTSAIIESKPEMSAVEPTKPAIKLKFRLPPAPNFPVKSEPTSPKETVHQPPLKIRIKLPKSGDSSSDESRRNQKTKKKDKHRRKSSKNSSDDDLKVVYQKPLLLKVKRSSLK